jgi:hypothetical protein
VAEPPVEEAPAHMSVMLPHTPVARHEAVALPPYVQLALQVPPSVVPLHEAGHVPLLGLGVGVPKQLVGELAGAALHVPVACALHKPLDKHFTVTGLEEP